MHRSSPKFKPTDVHSVKDRTKYLRNLHEQVNKSRMAVETITCFKNTQMKFKKKIDEVQEDLHSCVLRINHESKKNVVLKELLSVIRSEMFDFQKNYKKEEEKLDSDSEKRIKKIQYDIEQVLQKHNEEIAKITSLKQLASGGRSERVVFSNLFKKLEKQIKQNEENYKESLIKSESAKDRAPRLLELQRVPLQQEDDFRNMTSSRHSETNADLVPLDSNFMPIDREQSHFLTLQKNMSGQEKKNHDRKTHANKDSVHSEYVDPTMSATGFFGQKITEYENFLESIKLQIGCDGELTESLKFFENIGLSNDNLSAQINIYSEEVEKFEHMIREIKQQQRTSECYDAQRQLPLGSCRRIRIQTEANFSEKEKPSLQEMTEVLWQINSCFLPQTQSSEKNQFSNEYLTELDSKLDFLMKETREGDNFHVGISSSHSNNRATTVTSESNAVDILLEKMERFSECEKLLDKNLFKQEYAKEMNKNKKATKVKRNL